MEPHALFSCRAYLRFWQSAEHTVYDAFLRNDLSDSVSVPNNSASILTSRKGDRGNKSYIRIPLFFLFLLYLFEITLKPSGKGCEWFRTASPMFFYGRFFEIFRLCVRKFTTSKPWIFPNVDSRNIRIQKNTMLILGNSIYKWVPS